MQTIRTNLINNASTQYTNHNFTSMCMFNGVMIGAGPDGLFRLACSDNDNGVDISASITTFISNLAYEGDKKLRYFYLGIETEGTIIITPTVDGIAKIPVTITPVITGKQYMSLSIGRDSNGCYWSFKIENVDGCWFALHEVSVLPIYLSMGRKRLRA